ncbi:ADP-ribosylglycohydrolase family protein [Gallibacterium anatis]|uniref:ADP-ribosylglycohydrolase family protein n=1 Tax=Gallibacterium anatis TaxID=750 RepID=UPI001E5D05C0|nr:ADP-ribosylglycohydrolase family protein [Gallibacterium anatis]
MHSYPNGMRELADGGTWDTIAGQPTDDSEMALLLARQLAKTHTYDAKAMQNAYRFWLNSQPFDCGMTIASALLGQKNPNSQANGALMRISPLGILGANYPLETVADWAMQDAQLTHPNPVCQQANALMAMAIADAIHQNTDAESLFLKIKHWAKELSVDDLLLQAIEEAENAPPKDYITQQGWVIIAFHNMLWQLKHAENLESAVIDTVMRGGDTDTNAAICGALLGAVYGVNATPDQWLTAILNCRPAMGLPSVKRPRPECFWPVDALELAEQLVTSS